MSGAPGFGGAGLRVRDAGPADAAVVAGLHAASWRTSYRGILADAYLDGPVEAERAAFWAARLASGADSADLLVLLAESAGKTGDAAVGEVVGEAVGFAGLVLAADPRWGTLVDNLHVAPARKGGGIGRALMAQAAARLLAAGRDEPLHLFVFEANAAARGFYERVGGRAAEHFAKVERDGREHPIVRYAWSSPATLRAGCA